MSRKTGNEAEDHAVTYLQSQGMRIITRNFTCRLGEIDIIARDGQQWVFIEVRYRISWEAAIDSIGEAKQQKIYRAAAYYISRRAPEAMCRFDVIAIDRHNRIRWLKEAF